jgi:hypothetical protein
MAIQGEFCTFYGVTNPKALGERVGYNFHSVGSTCSFHSAYCVGTRLVWWRASSHSTTKLPDMIQRNCGKSTGASKFGLL